MHTRKNVQRLHQAHADYIEQTYRGLAAIPGNPHQIEIERVGKVRTFCSNDNSIMNRAIFSGTESEEEVCSVLTTLIDKGVESFVEVNPANFHPNIPSTWRSPLIPLLLDRGFWIRAFRCVWAYERDQGETKAETVGSFDIHHIDYTQLEVYMDDLLTAEEAQPDAVQARRTALLHGEGSAQWLHYLAYENGVPCATATLFINGEFGYLAWGFTKPAYRQRGYHHALIARRVNDAKAYGCDTIFSVSDFTNQSALNLQRAGFRLAYNYLLMGSKD